MDSSGSRHQAFLTNPWWAIGEQFGGSSLRLNETATRARAGLLNALAATTIFMLLAVPHLDPVIYVGPFVIFDMFAAAAFGLTPLSPVGAMGTLLATRAKALWKPAAPKRFAWILGGTLGVACLSMRLLHVDNAWIVGVLAICFVLTWLEAALGFCVGCWMYGLIWGCDECAA